MRTLNTLTFLLTMSTLLALAGCGGTSSGGSDDGGPGNGGIDGASADVVAPGDADPGADAAIEPGTDVVGPAEDAVAADVPADVGSPDVGAPTPYLSERHRTRAVDLGDQALDEYGYTDDVLFTVPEGIDSFFVSVDGEDGVYYVLTTLCAPDEHFLVPRNWDQYGDPSLCLACENRISAAEGTGTFMVPAAPQVPVEAGEYVVRVRGFRMSFGSNIFAPPTISPATEPVRLQILLKEPLPVGTMADLDLNLHFTGAGGVTAATAPGHQTIEDMLDTIESIYGAVGVQLGDIRYYDAPSELQMIESMMGEDADLSRLFRNSEGTPPALNLFFVDTITDRSNPMGGFGVILGIAGGIPGPPLSNGSPRSGVAIVIEPPFIAASVTVGTIAAHESGHYLGLYHTTEQPLVGSVHDQIEDTPKNTGANLMYYTSDGADPALTEGQGFVMRRHPLIYSRAWVDAAEGTR